MDTINDITCTVWARRTPKIWSVTPGDAPAVEEQIEGFKLMILIYCGIKISFRKQYLNKSFHILCVSFTKKK